MAWIRLGPAAGLPLIVLHGGGLDRAGASWRPVLPDLARTRPVIAPDLPGHGLSQPLHRLRDIADLGRWLAALLDHLALPRAAITGVSMGGAIALWLGLTAPRRVAGLVPVASYGLARRAPLHPLAYATTRLPLNQMADPIIARSAVAARIALRTIIHDPARIPDWIIDELREIAWTTRADQAFDRFLQAELEAGGLRTWLLPQLSQLKPPALFVHGRHDTAVPLAAARQAAERSGSPIVELDAGHWPMLERPEDFLAAVLPFLDRLD